MITCEDKMGLEERRAQIKNHAASAFREHTLTQEGEGRWYCGKPGTGFYHFRVISAPGTIVLFGDIESLVLRPSGNNALHWLRSVLHPDKEVDSISYVLEKAEYVFKVRQVFLYKEALALIKEEKKEAQENEEAEDLLRNKEWGERFDEERSLTDDTPGCCGEYLAWAQAFLKHFYDCEGIDSPLDFGSQILFQFHALRKFVDLLVRKENVGKQ